MPVTLTQKTDLASSSFSNANTNGAGGIVIRTDLGSDVKTAIDAAISSVPSGLSAVFASAAVSPAVAAREYVTDTTGAAFTITLPATPTDKDTIAFTDRTGAWVTNNLTVARNGKTIDGIASDYVLNVARGYLKLTYRAAGNDWAVTEFKAAAAAGATVATNSDVALGTDNTKVITPKLLADNVVQRYSATRNYAIGDTFVYQGALYRVTTAGVIASMPSSNVVSTTSGAYDSARNYAIGDTFVYQGVLYRVTTAGTIASMPSANVTGSEVGYYSNARYYAIGESFMYGGQLYNVTTAGIIASMPSVNVTAAYTIPASVSNTGKIFYAMGA